ncbi:hypothetical protein D3C78_1926920 [compost metagenome]
MYLEENSPLSTLVFEAVKFSEISVRSNDASGSSNLEVADFLLFSVALSMKMFSGDTFEKLSFINLKKRSVGWDR